MAAHCTLLRPMTRSRNRRYKSTPFFGADFWYVWLRRKQLQMVPVSLTTHLWTRLATTWSTQKECSPDCSTKVPTVQIQFQVIIYSSPWDIPDNVEPIQLPRFPLTLTSVNTRTSPELLTTGMLFLTRPVQHHLVIPSVQHSTNYPHLSIRSG